MINKSAFAIKLDDSEEIRLEKFTALLVAGSCVLAGFVWALMYYMLFGWGLTTLLPLSFSILVGSSLIVSHLRKNHYYSVYAQIFCIIYITLFIQWSIGGVFDSGFVLIWSFIGPITALIFFSFKKSIFYFLLFILNILLTILFDDIFSSNGFLVSAETQKMLFLMNFAVSALVVFVFAGYFVSSAREERKRANSLLLNVLPRKIARALKNNTETIAERFDSGSVLFADMVGSTPLFAELEATEVVEILNEVFTVFDQLTEKYGLEKIQTIGDNYMVASGVPTAIEEHAKILALFALEMNEKIASMPERIGEKMKFRIGINSGPLVAGVIGTSKFHYDVWGDTVNVASRMESHGEAEKIQISKSTYDLIHQDFNCDYRGEINIKGKGPMPTWYLISAKN